MWVAIAVAVVVWVLISFGIAACIAIPSLRDRHRGEPRPDEHDRTDDRAA